MLRNIILDVGDVLLEYRWKEMLLDYGMEEDKAEELGDLLFSDPLWEEFDVALRPWEDIVEDYVKKYPQYAEEITWFVNHGELMQVPRPDVWEQVHALKEKGYNLYILSNYSEKLFALHTKEAPFLQDMDGMVVSYQIHKKKPEPEIYEYLLGKYQLRPEECLFFDDRPVNCQGAENVGIAAMVVESGQQLAEELRRLEPVKK